MTTEKVCELIKHHLGELTDGHLLICFTRDGVPIVHQRVPDAKTALAINHILVSLVQAGGATTDAETE